MLVVPAEAEAVLVVPTLEAPRVVERPELFALAPWGETADPLERVDGLLPSGARVAMGDRTWARFVLDLAHRRPDLELRRAAEVVGPLRARKDEAEIEALRRGGRRRRPGRGPAPGRRDRPGRPHRGRGVGGARPPPAGGGSPVGQLRHRRLRAQCRQSPPRRRRSAHRGRRGGALRLRRHLAGRRGGRLLLRHHPLRPHRRRPARSSRSCTTCSSEAQADAVAAATVGHQLRGRGRGRPRPDRRRRLRRPLHPPHRSRHRRRGPRGPLPGGRQRASCSRWATPSRSSPASTCRGGGAPAWRTSSSPPTDGPRALNQADHDLVVVDR